MKLIIIQYCFAEHISLLFFWLGEGGGDGCEVTLDFDKHIFPWYSADVILLEIRIILHSGKYGI